LCYGEYNATWTSTDVTASCTNSDGIINAYVFVSTMLLTEENIFLPIFEGTIDVGLDVAAQDSHSKEYHLRQWSRLSVD